MYTTVDKMTADSSIYAPVGDIASGQMVMQTCSDGRMFMGEVLGLNSDKQNIDILHETGLLMKMNPHEPVLLIGEKF